MKLSLTTPTDVLAQVAATFDFMPQDSIVVIGLSGKMTGAIMRTDLPDEEWTANRYGRWTAEQLKESGHDGAVLVTFSNQACPDETATVSEEIAHSDVVDGFHRGLLAHGLTTAGRFHVGGGRVVNHDDPGNAEPVTDAALSEAAQLKGLILWELTRTPEQVADEFEGTTRHLLDPVDPVESAEIDAADSLTEWEQAVTEVLVTGDAEAIASDSQRAADLLGMLTDGHRRDALLMAMAENRAAADRVLAGDSLTQRDEAVLTGETKGGPDWGRIDRMTLVLSALSPRIVEDAPAGQVLTIMVWVEYMRGAMSLAGVYLDRARDRDQLNGFLILIEQLMDRGFYSHWTKTREISWSGRRRY